MTWEPARPIELDLFLFRPVAEGFWKQYELSDGTYDLDDLFDIHEWMDIQDENRRRAGEAARRKE